MKKIDVQVDSSLSKELIVGNKLFRSTCDYHVTEKDLEKARKELKETEEKRRTCLEELKKKLSKDKRMRYRVDDDYLLRYLRYLKFDVQKTYKIIEHFYATRNEDPLLFTWNPDVEFKMRGKVINLMPYLHDNGELVFIHRFGYWDPSELSVRDFCAIFNCVSDVLSTNPHAQIAGVIVIFDFGGVSARLVSELVYPPNLKLFTKVLQEMYPWRVKKVVFFNCSAVIRASISFVRYFLKKKINDRIELVRSDLGELHKHVNPSILPKEYGGNLDDEECFSYMKKVVVSNKEYLRYENSFIRYKE